MAVTIMPGIGNLTGYVTYDNSNSTGLNGVILTLRNTANGAIVGTTTSGPNPLNNNQPGYYSFYNVADGTYQITGSFNGSWGGNNATDALIVQLYVIGQYPSLTGLRLVVADVNASGPPLPVTGLDALYIKLRTIGSITSYPAGDWKFEIPTFTVTTPAPYTQNILGLCVGDVNGSFIPANTKEALLLSVVEEGVQTIPVNKSFIYNIHSNRDADLGAMTLFMAYDQNRFEIENVNTSLDGMRYVIDNGRIALAWSDTKPLSVKNDDPIISLTMNAKELVSEATPIFSLLPGSEFADAKANKFENFDLRMASVITPNGINEFSMFNYPNPFNNTTTIVYTLPEPGHARIVLTDLYGKTIRILTDQQDIAGSHSVTVDPAGLSMKPGVYLYKIIFNSATDTYTKANKMVFTR